METVKDPVQTDNNESSDRVGRGGGWGGGADYLVVSLRAYYSPGDRSRLLGFRPVRNVKEKVC